MSRLDNFTPLERLLWRISRNCLNDYLYSFFSLKRWDTLNPDLQSPRTFNEKIRYLSLHDRRLIYSCFADKLQSKELVKCIADSSVVTPTLKKWSSADQISFDGLPPNFVLKSNHASGDVFFVSNNDEATLRRAILHFRKSLATDYYLAGREWAYKHIHRYVFAEELIPVDRESLIDYKFFCFNGSPRFVQVDTSRFSNHKRDFYDLDWNPLDWELEYQRSDYQLNRPSNLADMIDMSKQLSKLFPFCRVDLYNFSAYGKTHVRFGELTFYPDGATARFKPDELNVILGSMISLDAI